MENRDSVTQYPTVYVCKFGIKPNYVCKFGKTAYVCKFGIVHNWIVITSTCILLLE